ncbi:hypothetical protein [Flavobacterium sp. ASW18X]|uniref:DUF6913 domain-containing protein n=1 Tax=Flavobacterium sp. ASW18X TaxID=2572595 RepID=UPI0010AE48F2|nr:hypothetical protein [Flavobacterium sp. ASW18X]TKD65841.1 hypothetical protein FBT53_02950 [Flavobacterium sp. ASW18X]
MFKVIQDKFKIKSAKKFVEDKLNQESSLNNKKGIGNVACIVDMDQFNNAEIFKELKNTLGLKPNAVQIIGYKRGKDKNGMFSIPFCTDKDLGWNGSVENGDFSEFMGRPYDVLINYFTDDRLFLKLMSLHVDARIRVGLVGGDNALSDLILGAQMNDYNTFKNELKKYLTILNEI